MALAFFLLLACLLLTAALQLQGQVITVTPQVWTNSPSSQLYTVTYKDGSAVSLVLGGGPSYTGRPSFAAGFYCASPCESFLFAVFLATDVNSDLPAMAQVVWTPNRDRPVHANATLSLRTNGGLVLLDADGSLVWSTNTTGKAVGGMTLTDSGNLMLLGWKNKAVWQSFDHPADSLVPGQSLAEGMKLTPTASPAASEQFYLSVLSDGLYAFVGSSPPQLYYRMSTSEAVSRKRPTYVVFRNGSLDIFIDSYAGAGPDETINLQPASSHQYMRFEADGHLRLYEWQLGWAMVQDVLVVDGGDCGYPTVCGEYGICLNGQCTCPFEANTSITYFRQIDSWRINLGCEPVTAISCQSIRDHKLLVFPNVSYFNYIDPDAAQPQLIDEDSCKQACLRNCSCKAAVFMYYDNTSDGSCYLPSRLFSLQVIAPETVRYYSTSYIKVQITQPAPSLATPVAQTSSSGYLAPEWLTSQITEKADVYSFGVVVMEVIGGRKNLDSSQPGFLASKWLTSQITEKEDIYSFGVVVMEVIGGRKNLDSSQLGYTSEKPYLFSTLQNALADALWLRVTVLYFTCLAPRIVPQPCLSPLGSG